MTTLVDRLSDATKAAMKAREKDRVAALRLVNAEIKRVQVDERRDLSDEDVVALLARMVKQRNDSLQQFRDAGRDDLVAKEQFELDIIAEFLPQALTEAELAEAVDGAIAETGASGMQDMGKVMGLLKGPLSGRADMAAVSQLVKAKLAG